MGTRMPALCPRMRSTARPRELFKPRDWPVDHRCYSPGRTSVATLAFTVTSPVVNCSCTEKYNNAGSTSLLIYPCGSPVNPTLPKQRT